ncbi:MAG: signal peptidase I [Actinomycetaceae bacterium]|nr:signal peptidase I [Actinomycetaceae bacterium]
MNHSSLPPRNTRRNGLPPSIPPRSQRRRARSSSGLALPGDSTAPKELHTHQGKAQQRSGTESMQTTPRHPGMPSTPQFPPPRDRVSQPAGTARSAPPSAVNTPPISRPPSRKERSQQLEADSRTQHSFHDEQHKESKKRVSKTWLALREVIMVFVVALAISALIKAFLIQAFIIPSQSMEDTLQVNDRVLVSKLVPSMRQINRGDIIVFEDAHNWLQTPPDHSPFSYIKEALIALGLRPDDSENHLIKRVIGLPGDHVQCCDGDGSIVVNGVSVKEPYIKPGVAPSEIPFDVYLPADKLWVMGDNRANSGDSRYHLDDSDKGFVDVNDVTGRAFVIMWPFSRWETLSNTDAFAAVPASP